MLSGISETELFSLSPLGDGPKCFEGHVQMRKRQWKTRCCPMTKGDVVLAHCSADALLLGILEEGFEKWEQELVV
ncbi:hypothetical protein BKA19_3123 [Blastococcus saxobsidens]|uniref:Uncharacterized protein n=1 Tax=Blastococcus saxobsidens TaxID=138336 RepID=A0A4Q7YB26_9ACTN|nr:hypothetical protein BKA19_3123 [Blastococcus saxobsidens]